MTVNCESKTFQNEFVAHASSPCDLCRLDRNESGLDKHFLRCDVLVAHSGTKSSQRVLSIGSLAEFDQTRRRYSGTRELLTNAISNIR